MISTYSYKGAEWIQLVRPNLEEVKPVLEKYGVDPMIANDLLTPMPKPKVAERNGFIFLVLHFPAHRHSHSMGTKQEINLIIGRDFIITVQYDTIDALHKVAKELEVKSILSRGDDAAAAGAVFFRILEEAYRGIFDELAFISDWLSEIETNIFKGRERDMVFALSKVSQHLLDFKQIISFHKDVLESLEITGKRKFGEDFAIQVAAVRNEYSRIRRTLDGHMESMQELRETNNSLLSTKQNEIMKVLTIFAFLILPAQTIATLIQMPTNYTPLTGTPYDFWIILALIVVVSLGFYLFFRFKKWL